MAPDPQFPDRPDHPDFWKLSEAVQRNDVMVEGKTRAEARSYREYVGSVIDVESLMYMAEQRTALGLRSITEKGYDAEMVIASIWMDGFLAAADFFGVRNPATDGQHRGL